MSQGLIGEGTHTATLLGEKLRDQPDGFHFMQHHEIVADAVARHPNHQYRLPIIKAMHDYCPGKHSFSGRIQSVDSMTSIDIDVSVDTTPLAQAAAETYALEKLARMASQEMPDTIVGRQKQYNRLEHLWGKCKTTIDTNRHHATDTLTKVAERRRARVEEQYRHCGSTLLQILWWLTSTHLSSEGGNEQNKHFRIESRPEPGTSLPIPPEVLETIVRYGEMGTLIEKYAQNHADVVIGKATIPKTWWRPDIVYLLNGRNN